MIKPKLILISSASLVLIGIGITAYQSQITADNLSNQQETLGPGMHMIVSKNLNPSNNQKGVYSIQISDLQKDDNIKFFVTEPTGVQLAYNSITKTPIQEIFKITSLGNYTLQIENQGQREMQILGIIGYYPEDLELVDVAGFILLIVGLSGIAIGMMFLVRNRMKSN